MKNANVKHNNEYDHSFYDDELYPIEIPRTSATSTVILGPTAGRSVQRRIIKIPSPKNKLLGDYHYCWHN